MYKILLKNVSTILLFPFLEWADMCKLRTNLEKYGVVNTTKQDRKIIKKKNTNDLSQSDSNIKVLCLINSFFFTFNAIKLNIYSVKCEDNASYNLYTVLFHLFHFFIILCKLFHYLIMQNFFKFYIFFILRKQEQDRFHKRKRNIHHTQKKNIF